MQTVTYNATTIISTNSNGAIPATIYAAHFAAKDHNISLLEAYCLVKGIKVTTTSKAVVETIRAAVKVAHPTKLRAKPKAHKRNRKVAKAPRQGGLVLFKATTEVTQQTSRFEKARSLITKATQKVALKLGVSLKEVLGMNPRDIFNEEGRVIPLFRELMQAYKLVKALTA